MQMTLQMIILKVSFRKTLGDALTLCLSGQNVPSNSNKDQSLVYQFIIMKM